MSPAYNRKYSKTTKNKKNEPVKYLFTIYPYLCTQKTKAPMVKVRSTTKE